VEEAIYMGMDGDRIYVRATGHITAALCPELKTKCFARFEVAPPVSAVYIDLSSCDYMDSTFLGLIVGLTKRLMAKARKKLTIVAANDACLGLLKTIGVLGLLEDSRESPPFPERMERIGRGSAATAEFLLDAHEELSSLSDDNRAKFSALTSLLRDSMRKPGAGHEDRGEG
jgi:anti-anti-sigma factor